MWRIMVSLGALIPSGGVEEISYSSVDLSVLRTTGWLAKIESSVQYQFLRHATVRYYKRGKNVCNVGDSSDVLYGVVSGSLTLSVPRKDGQLVEVFRLGSGQWHGGLAIFSEQSEFVSAHANTDTVVVNIHACDIRKIARLDPRILQSIYSLSHEYMSLAFLIISGLTKRSARGKIAIRLLLLDERAEREATWLNCSQSCLAESLGLSVPTVQRTLTKFALQGFVRLGYKRIHVLDRAGLSVETEAK